MSCSHSVLQRSDIPPLFKNTRCLSVSLSSPATHPLLSVGTLMKYAFIKAHWSPPTRSTDDLITRRGAGEPAADSVVYKWGVFVSSKMELRDVWLKQTDGMKITAAPVLQIKAHCVDPWDPSTCLVFFFLIFALAPVDQGNSVSPLVGSCGSLVCTCPTGLLCSEVPPGVKLRVGTVGI